MLRGLGLCLLAAIGIATAAEPVGYLDGVTGDVARGWAVDPDTPAAAVQVHLYVDGPPGQGRLLLGAAADTPRADVNALGYPGNHGFRVQLPGTLRDGQTHRLYVYAIDTAGGNNPQLAGSPLSFNLGAPAARTNSTRGLDWVRANPMFVSGLNVSMGPPSPQAVTDYFDSFGANAVHFWDDGLPFDLAGWHQARPGARWLSWITNDGLSRATNTFMGGIPANHPGRIGFQVGDEPRSMAELQRIAATLPAVRAHDPNALIVLNFTYHAPDIDQQLEHVGRNLDVDVLSYDHYSRSSSGVYAELERFRAAGLRHGLPYWRYLYAYQDNGPALTESDMRWNAFSGLVYGYTGHTWFLYQIGQAHSAGTGLLPQLFDRPGAFGASKTQHFNTAAQINRELLNLGRSITQLTSTDVRYEIGRWSFIRPWYVPGTRSWRRGAGGDPYLAKLDKNGRDLSLGFFRDAQNSQYVMIQNPSRTHGRQTSKGDRDRTYELEFDFSSAPAGFDRTTLQTLDKATGQVRPLPLQSLGPNRAKLVVTLPAGDPLLFKYSNGSAFAVR